MPPRAPIIARALGLVRSALDRLHAEHGPSPLLVACSGGADSMALLGLLQLVAAADGLDLCVGTVDHALRAASAGEVKFVLAAARRAGLRAASRRLALAPGPGLAARARDARYNALTEMADAFGAGGIALGHTATDQAETMLLHLIRGAGLDGLSAMPTLTTDRAPARLRPMLQLQRAESAVLCTALGIAFVTDPSNEDVAQPRIAIRNEVLPRLTALRPGADLALAAAAGIARDAEAALARWADLELTRLQTSPGVLQADDELRALPIEIQRRIVRAVALRAGVEPDAVGRRVLEDICRAVGAPGPSRSFDLKGGARCLLDAGVLRIVGPTARSPVR